MQTPWGELPVCDAHVQLFGRLNAIEPQCRRDRGGRRMGSAALAEIGIGAADARLILGETLEWVFT
jgi:hypothetical protein